MGEIDFRPLFQSRRGFLRATSEAVAGLVLWEEADAHGTEDENRRGAGPIIDCHTHFYDPTRPEGVPWPSKDDKLLYRRVLPEDYKRVARPLGVTGTVVVEASPWVEDNEWVLDLAAKDPFLVGLVGHLDPKNDPFREHLKRFAKNPLFRGIRVNHGPLATGLGDSQFVANLKRLIDHDLELDVNGGPNMLPDVARLADLLPDLRIVVNHLANVRMDGKAPPPDWLAGMRGCARHENVSCKVSALVEGATPRDGKAPVEMAFYEPILNAVWDAFGEDRLIYGSNWPVSERFASYATVQDIVSDFFHSQGPAAAKKFFFQNSKLAYKWVRLPSPDSPP